MKVDSTSIKFLDALHSKTLQAYEMFYMDYDGGIFLTNAPMDITYAGETYTSVGGFLGFSNITEEQEFGAKEVTVTLAGLPLHDMLDPDDGEHYNFFSEFVNNNYVDLKVKIHRAFFKNDVLIKEANGDEAILLMFEGRVDHPTIVDSPIEQTIISISVVNNWGDFERINGRFTNDNDQQRYLVDNATCSDLEWTTEAKCEENGGTWTSLAPDKGFIFASDNIKDIAWIKDADEE
jgi:hypothetical protein